MKIKNSFKYNNPLLTIKVTGALYSFNLTNLESANPTKQLIILITNNPTI